MKIMNRRPFAVEIVDPDDADATYSCAARPGTVEVPDKLGRALLAQEDNWQRAEDDKPKRGKSADTEET